MKQRFALELYSVRDDLARDFLGTLKAVKAMGYEGVEFAGGYVHTAEEVAAALKETGLVCCGWHTPFDYVQDDKLEATIAYNKVIGNHYVIIPGVWGDYSASPAAWRKTAEIFNGISKKLTLQGMVKGYHNHDFEFKPLDGEIPYNIFFDNTDKAVVMQLDNGNAMQGGADTCALLKKYPGRAKTVHLKPYSQKDGFDTVIGEDEVPWTEFMGLCQSVGGTEWYIVEYESEKLFTPLEGVKKNIDALRKLQAEGKI
jgi:sugar phosphate isomerase/epimerase